MSNTNADGRLRQMLCQIQVQMGQSDAVVDIHVNNGECTSIHVLTREQTYMIDVCSIYSPGRHGEVLLGQGQMVNSQVAIVSLLLNMTRQSTVHADVIEHLGLFSVST